MHPLIESYRLATASTTFENATARTDDDVRLAADERRRARNHPIARWFLRPTAEMAAAYCADSWIRPWHVTLCGLLCGVASAAVLWASPSLAPWAAGGVLLMWWLDLADGVLARRQGTASAAGAWLDANVDEFTDMLLHAGVAAAASAQMEATWPWACYMAFVAGKYLFMYGVTAEAATPRANDDATPSTEWNVRRVARALYHGVGNADMRVHVLALALVFHQFAAELVLYAAYYNFRWIVRYPLALRRLSQAERQEAAR